MTSMKRRTFLAAYGSTAAAMAWEVACQDRSSSRSTAVNASGDFELDEISVSQMATGLRAGKWTSTKLTELYLSRIESLDRNGPRLNSVLEVNPDVMTLARQLDQDRKNNRVRGPLHGVPILIKDNIQTRDRMTTTGGSLALAQWYAGQDAFVIARLRAAGALILGKTNLSEWANFRSTHSISGWSGRGGQTHNPYALDRNPSRVKLWFSCRDRREFVRCLHWNRD